MQIESAAKMYKALSEPVRLQILDFLQKETTCKCICHIGEHIGKDQSTAFRHIRILEDAGLVKTSKDAKFLMCCVKDKKKVRKLLEVGK